MAQKVRSLSPAYLALALPLAAAYLFFELGAPWADKTLPQSSYVLFSAVTLIVCALVFGGAVLLEKRHAAAKRKPLLLVDVFFMAAGEAVYLAQPSLPAVLPTIGAAVLVGYGGAQILLAWGRAYGFLPKVSALVHSAGAFILAAVLYCVVNLVSLSIEPTLMVVALAALSALPLEFLFSTPRTSQASTVGGGEDSTTQGRWAFFVFLREGWRPYAGFLLCWVITACRLGTSLSEPPIVGTTDPQYGMLFGIVVAGIVMLIAHLTFRSHPERFAFFLRITPVTATGLLLLSWFFVLISVTLVFAASFVMGLGVGFLSIMAWAALSEVSARQDAPATCFGMAGAITVIAVLLFAVLAYFLSTAAEYVSPILTLSYLVLVNLNFGKAPVESQPVVAMSDKELFEVQLEQIRATYHISPRECEVLSLLANGYSAGYIAETLCISQNSVKTHTRHLYEKLGIHKRNELIDFVNSLPETAN